MADNELAFYSAVGQARLVRTGAVSARELVDLYLARIDALDSALNCYITVDEVGARAAAATADAAADDDRGPFHGVPIAIKDMADTVNIRTTWGSAAFHDRVPRADAPAVKRLKAAGFIIVGKTNTPEFAFGPTDPVGYGPCHNPWNPMRSVSGSSGGSAAAVAAGLCAVAHGSDAGGSIRQPAAACGVVGLKPSRGRVPNDLPGFDWLSQEGPLSRTVEDAAAVLDCIAGPAAGDPYRVASLARPYTEELHEPPPRLRIGYLTDAVDESSTRAGSGYTTEPIMKEAVIRAASVLDAAGHDVMEAGPDWGGMTHAIAITHYHSAAWLAIEPQLPPRDLLDPIQQQAMAEIEGVTLQAYLQVLNRALLRARQVETFWVDHDILLTPTLAGIPPLVSNLRRADGGTAELNEGPFTFFWNITGQPAISLPVHHAPDGFPVGVQLVARTGGEATLVRLAAQLELLMPWGSTPTKCELILSRLILGTSQLQDTARFTS
jgi:amidase